MSYIFINSTTYLAMSEYSLPGRNGPFEGFPATPIWFPPPIFQPMSSGPLAKRIKQEVIDE